MDLTRYTQFRRACLLSGLISQDQMDDAVAELRSLAGDTMLQVTDEMLSEKLIDLAWLTPYQAQQLSAGRTKLNLGPYVIIEFIGQGGMGQVFKAEHEMMGRQSAVKVLPLSKSTPEAISSFTREIRTQAQLDHPNLVRAFDAGHDGNVHYLVTEYVPGTDLRRLVRSQGQLTMQQAASVTRQSALALHYAHSQGLIHRDVKPGNILVTPEGVAKVSDLGLAGFMHEGDADPKAGKIVGTADYLSPEQIRSPADITAASDIYSLGCTLYYAITGKVPFPGGTAKEKARRHLEETPWHPRRFNPDISEEFVEVIADMMEKDVANRIQTAEELAVRLEPWADEASPLPSGRMGKQPWTAPPLPTDDGESETHDGEYFDEELDPHRQESGLSQISQKTEPVASGSQETRPVKQPRPSGPPPLRVSPHAHRRSASDSSVAMALMIAVPVSLAIGIAIGFVLHWIFTS